MKVWKFNNKAKQKIQENTKKKGMFYFTSSLWLPVTAGVLRGEKAITGMQEVAFIEFFIKTHRLMLTLLGMANF